MHNSVVLEEVMQRLYKLKVESYICVQSLACTSQCYSSALNQFARATLSGRYS